MADFQAGWKSSISVENNGENRNKVEMIQIETSKIGTLGITTFCLWTG